jgi:hypothetical protein
MFYVYASSSQTFLNVIDFAYAAITYNERSVWENTLKIYKECDKKLIESHPKYSIVDVEIKV